MSGTLIIMLWLSAAAIAFVVARRSAERSAASPRRGGLLNPPDDGRRSSTDRQRTPRVAAPTETAGDGSERRPRPSRGRRRSATGPVSINSAGVEELCRLPGVGRRAAERIVRYRDSAGTFDSFDDLCAVEGFTHDRVRRLSEMARL